MYVLMVGLGAAAFALLLAGFVLAIVDACCDVHHEAFAVDEVDAVYDVMLAADHHDYQVQRGVGAARAE